MLAGEPWGFRLQCQDPIVGTLLLNLNDRLDDERRQQLAPYLLRSLGTAKDGKQEERRQLVNEWLLHRAVPPYLDLAGLDEVAERLRGLPATLSSEAMRKELWRVRDEAWGEQSQARRKLREAVRAELEKRGALASADIA